MKREKFKKFYAPVILICVLFSMICVGDIGARAATTAIISAQPSDLTLYVGSPATISVTATGSGTLSYQWYVNLKNNSTDGTKVTGASSASYSPPTKIAKTSYYYCVVSLRDTELTSITSGIAKVVVKSRPKIFLQPQPASSYVGGLVTLTLKATGSGVLSYQWYSNTKNSVTGASAVDTAIDSTYAVPTTAAFSRYYFCVVTNTDTSISETAVTVTSSVVKVSITDATYIPKITLQPTSVTAYAGASAKLRIAAFGSGTLTYQWYSNTTNSVSDSSKISGAVNGVYSASTGAGGTLYYYCVVTDTVATTSGTQTYTITSDIVYVKVNTGVAISLQPLDAAVYVGTAVPLAVTAAGNGTLKYQWYLNSVSSTDNGIAISGATGNRYEAPTTTSGTLYYYCGITNTATSNTAAVTINSSVVSVRAAALPVITTQPTGVSANVGDTVTLSAAASGSGSLTYQWYINTRNSMTGGSKVLNGTDSSCTVSTDVPGTAYYYCVVTNTDNSLTGLKSAVVTSNSVAVAIKVVDISAPTISKNPSSLSTVEGDTVSLSLTVSGSGAFSYQWYSNTKRSMNDASVITGATESSLSVSTAVLGTTYYYCVVTNTDNSMPGLKSASTSSNITSVTVLPLLPKISQQPVSAVVYIGNSAYLSIKAAGSGLLCYQWYSNTVNDNSTGTAISGAINAKYTVPTDSVGTVYYYCVVTNTIKKAIGTVTGSLTSDVCAIEVAAGPTISAQPEGAVINSGESLTLTIEASGSGKLTYQWYTSSYDKNTGGTLIRGASSKEYKISTTVGSLTSTSYYYCVVTNTDSSIASGKSALTASDTAKVTVLAVNAAAPRITSNPINQAVKVGTELVLTVEASASGTVSYQWYKNTRSSTVGAVAESGATDASYTITLATAGAAYYYCVVTNTDESMSGTKTASASSKIVKISATA